MKRLLFALSLALLSGLSVSTSPAQQSQASSASADNPAVRRAKELAQVINAGKLAEARKYVQENYAPGFLNTPMDRHLDFIAWVHDQTRGVEFQRVQEEKPGEATIVLKNKLTGGFKGLFVRVEPESPYRISGLGLRPVNPPAGAKPVAKLTEEQMARELDTFISKLAEADVFSGAALLAKDGKVIYKKAFGMANKDFNAPNRVDTKFNLGWQLLQQEVYGILARALSHDQRFHGAGERREAGLRAGNVVALQQHRNARARRGDRKGHGPELL